MKNNYKDLDNRIFIILVIIVGVALLSFFIPVSSDGKLHIWFLDVGQGDAIFIQTPKGAQILIDGGPGKNVLKELGEVMPFYDKSLDVVILTHSDADHLSGLVDVLERFKVERIIETGLNCQTNLCDAWEKSKRLEEATEEIAKFGDALAISDDVKIDIIHPFVDLNNSDMTKQNNSSVVLILSYNGRKLLLPGDIESPAEEKIVLSGIDIDVDFIKLAHHGSKTSTSDLFFKKASPLYAFIEVGAGNKFNHPSPEVIERLEQSGIPYYRTDINGRTELIIDRYNYEIKTEN